jgi:hypothetical protein
VAVPCRILDGDSNGDVEDDDDDDDRLDGTVLVDKDTGVVGAVVFVVIGWVVDDEDHTKARE